MRHPDKAQKVSALALFIAVVYAVVVFFIPEGFSRILGFAAEAAFYFTFQKIQEREFAEWQTANSSLLPSNGWKAVGWGFAGLILFVLIFFLIVFLLGLAGFQPR